MLNSFIKVDVGSTKTVYRYLNVSNIAMFENATWNTVNTKLPGSTITMSSGKTFTVNAPAAQIHQAIEFAQANAVDRFSESMQEGV